jgi:tetratricopeptide (TPR) repeat protein
MIQIPLGLLHALETEECVLFLGAGIGFNLFNDDKRRLPLARELAEELAEHFSIDASNVSDLSKIAAVVELRKGRAELEAYIRKRLSNLEPDASLKWLFTRRWRAIFTTNYDYGIQRTYELNPNPPQIPITITSTSEIVHYDSRFEVPIYHLHGCLFTSSQPHIVITDNDYALFREQRRMMFELLKKEFATSTILYIGYSNQDHNWKTVLSEMAQEFSPYPTPRAYRVAPNTDLIDAEILRAQYIETIDATLSDFCESAQVAIRSIPNSDRLERMRSTIPPQLTEAFDKNPAAVSRLLNSWEYVNQVAFSDRPNLYNFLRGDRPNWALIGAKEVFERDVEEEIYESILDYVTSEAKKPSVKTLLAPAGYGVTTLMMTLATKIVQEQAGPVFMLKPTQPLLEGDIEFACSLFPQIPLFFIDNAADHINELNSATNRLKDINQAALFFLGERLNEWRQAYSVPRTQEYELEPLTDPEIIRLLNYLKKHSALNALASLPFDLQIEAVKQKHAKDLLVVMREVTEGKSFDAILEDEFRGIADATSRQLYLITCCFYQHGVYVRDKLLESMLDLPLPQLYDLTTNATEGVVSYELINEAQGNYGARARHRIIAAVVWERCSTLGEKESILQTALEKLNLNYSSDKDAFEYFTRTDRVVDTIQTVEGRIRFFDKACQKDINSPYVRQHYARMLLRAKLYEFALHQIDAAINLAPRARILYHTKGHILSEMAFNVSSVDLARRWLAQSEANFKQALNIQRHDEYSYQGIARLYFGWAKRITDEVEQTNYITKAEEIISEGLRKVRVRDGLWIVSAEIQDWLNDQHSRIEALQKAVRESPNSVIARYLLARAYRKNNQPDEAIEVINPVLRQDINEFRVTVEYAIALLSTGKSYADAIAILNLSTLSGLRDPRFISTLGGMYFLNGEFSKSEEIFRETQRHDFTSHEKRTIQFRPPNPRKLTEPFHLHGTVAVVKAGFAYIEVLGYPRVFCPSTRYAGIVMQKGLKVKFELAFNSIGAVVDKPKLV